ncbi:MAG: hypothetical protein JO090_07775, partial [Rhizobacter sp.]|nr:hypothetical protein [Rhizobacter sp.]
MHSTQQIHTFGPNARRVARIAASLAVSAVACWVAFRAIDPEQLVANLRSAQLGWLLVGLLLYWCELAVRV